MVKEVEAQVVAATDSAQPGFGCGCRLHPNRWRRTVQVCVGWYRTPVTFSITSATLARVHMSVGYPLALGPRSSASSAPAALALSNRMNVAE